MARHGKPASRYRLTVGLMIYEKTAEEIVRNTNRSIRVENPRTMGIVRCDNYRCLALRSKDGKWRDAHGTELHVVEVVTEF
ncbi:MAG: hypothetical protein ACREIC_12335 [Limisphaerales bacterium]